MARRRHAPDFVITYDPKTDPMGTVGQKVLYHVIVRRLKGKKPAVLFIGGKSGEGKSYTALKLAELLLGMQGLDIAEYLDDVNVYTPAEYPVKLKAILHDKRLKKVNVLIVHEGRTLVSSKSWQSFTTQAIAHVNAMSRSIKRICFIIISQSIRDITVDIRHTIDFYCQAQRPIGRHVRLRINVMYMDERDLDNIKLRMRRLRGFMKNAETGRSRLLVPSFFEVTRPDKTIADLFDAADTKAKGSIIEKKMHKLIEAIRQETGEDDPKVSLMIDYYMKNPDNLRLIGKRWRGKWKLKKEAALMHSLSEPEIKEFQNGLNDRFKQMELIDDGQSE